MTRVLYEVTFKDGSQTLVGAYAEATAMENVASLKAVYVEVEEERRPLSEKRREWLEATGGKPSRAWA